jgi:hypothetical protein
MQMPTKQPSNGRVEDASNLESPSQLRLSLRCLPSQLRWLPAPPLETSRYPAMVCWSRPADENDSAAPKIYVGAASQKKNKTNHERN